MKRWIIIVVVAGASLFFYLNLFNTSAQLDAVEVELNSAQTQLKLTRTEMEATAGKLGTAETELQATKTRLQSTETKLATAETELQLTKEGLQSAETELASALESLNTLQTELDERESELNELQIDYEGLIAGHGYTIKDPTYRQMLSFIEDDDTDKAKYITGKYECVEFATDLCNRAEAKGIRCAYVSIRFPDGRGHAIVAFDTIDRGLIYIEPQYDDLVEIEIGKPFYKCVVPKPGYVYEKPDQDDTILKVMEAW
jgi:uncharacterized protein YukE